MSCEPLAGAPYEKAQLQPPSTFSQGDRVKVSLDVEVLKVMQEGHGGWNDQMAQVRSD